MNISMINWKITRKSGFRSNSKNQKEKRSDSSPRRIRRKKMGLNESTNLWVC